MAQIHIKRGIERVPGGMMIVPLLLGALVATFLPGMPKFFGSTVYLVRMSVNCLTILTAGKELAFRLRRTATFPKALTN